MTLAIGVDIGGTKVAAGVIAEDGKILDRVRIPTPSHDVDETEDAIVKVVTELNDRHDVIAVGIGAAGWIAADRGTVLFSPHLAWRNEPLREALADRIPLPILVENDANAAAWAEYRFGVAQNERVIACLTLGTGIGGGLVVSGTLFRGAHGVATEFGHRCMVPGGRRCACGNRGCFEMYASGTALARDAQELAESSPVAAHRMVELAGGVIANLTGHHVTRAAREGDPSALEIFTSMGRSLGLGIADLAAELDPSCFVIGGGLCEAGDLLLRPAQEAFASSLTGRGFRPVAEIRLAGFGAEAGMVGVADLARRRI